jgi:hypothetical protein
VFLDDAAGHKNSNYRVLDRQTHANGTFSSKVTVSIHSSSPEMFYPLIIDPNVRKTTRAHVYKGASTEHIRVNNAPIRGSGSCTLRYKRITLNFVVGHKILSLFMFRITNKMH